MGSVCCANRNKDLKVEVNSSNSNENGQIVEDYATEAITDEKLKCMYSNANKEENLEILIKLVENESKIQIEEASLRFNWITQPETLGDIAIIQIYTIIQKRVKAFVYEERCAETSQAKILLKNKIDATIQTLVGICFIDKMVVLLESKSFTKKDSAILILCSLSNCRHLLTLMMDKKLIASLINHVNRFRQISIYLSSVILYIEYVNFKEHIIVTLQLLKRIYVKEVSLRKVFVDLGGVQFLYEFLSCGDVDIIMEALYNIEDLIYRDDENEYYSISKLVIPDMKETLIKMNIETVLYDLYQECHKNRQKYGVVIEDLKRLILVFVDKPYFRCEDNNEIGINKKF